MKSGSLIQSLMKVLLIIAVAGGMCGCRNKHQEKLEMALEKSTAIKDDQNADGQNVTIETEGNRVEIQGEHASWPEEMPRDVPEFTYGTLKNLTMTQTPESRSWTILADHIPENVIREYEERLKTSGF